MKVVAGIALSLVLGAGTSAVATSAAADPVVVELFTSQGCEECWRANAVAAEIARRPDVLVLTYAVDYLDYLGWPDSFARPEFSARQEAYKSRLKLRMLMTPQVIIDGNGQATGFDRSALSALIDRYLGSPPGAPDVRITSRGSRALVKAGRVPAGGAEVWLVRYDPRALNVTVTKGENRGRRILHKNVVRELVRLGSWTGRGRTYALPAPSDPALRTAVLVQARRTGRVMAAERA